MHNLALELKQGGLEVLAGFAEEWRELLERGSGGDPYARPEWIIAYLRAYSPRARVVALSAKRGGHLCALLPLTWKNGSFAGLPARKLRVPLPMPGSNTPLVLDPDVDEDTTLRALWASLRHFPGWDVLELPSVYENAAVERLCRIASGQGYHTGGWSLLPLPWLPLDGGDMEKLPPGATLRSRLRQAERKLAALGDLRLHVFAKADAGVLQRFYDLEASGWKGREKSAILCDQRSRQFFNEVARESERFHYLSLYFLELSDRLISAHFGLNYRGRYYAPKIAYDEAYRQYRPGHLMVQKILRECVPRGISAYPMGVQEEWKLEWTKQLHQRTFQCIFNQGAWARILFTARFQIRPALKKLIRRPVRPEHAKFV